MTMTLREAISEASARLAVNPEIRANAARDAELLLLETIGRSRTVIFTDPMLALSGDEEARFRAAIERRLTNEPIQHITGFQEFYGLRLRVNSAVLIPRPETELLVEAILERVSAEGSLRLLDVGTGSGALALALAANLPHAVVIAVDLSPAALAVARENAAELGLRERIRFVESDLLEGLAETQAFDVIVSNPPYIPEGDRGGLHAEVREFEPESALFAGEDGLAVYRRLIPQAWAALRPGGLLGLEFGYGQREALAELLVGWDEVRFLDDLQGIARVALARKA